MKTFLALTLATLGAGFGWPPPSGFPSESEVSEDEGDFRHPLQQQFEDVPERRRWGGHVVSDAFTVLFFADLENNYREHTSAHSRRFLEAVRDIRQKNLRFDGSYSGHTVDPKLFIHGGDINRGGWKHGFEGTRDPFYTKEGLRDVDWEFEDVWNVMDGYPTISNFGNHDWEDADTTIFEERWGTDNRWTAEEQTTSNQKTMEFVRKTMERAGRLGVSYETINPDGDVGPVSYVANFRGVQIVMFQTHFELGSYDFANGGKTATYTADAQFNRVVAKVDKSKTTLVVHHYPLNDVPGWGGDDNNAERKKFGKLMQGLSASRAAILTGHDHRQYTTSEKFNGVTYTDYTVAYPTDRYEPKHSATQAQRKNGPGAYAVLVSPSQGVLQVKAVDVDPSCWGEGTKCLPGTTCESECCHDSDWNSHWYSHMHQACGFEDKWEDGRTCVSGITCDACANGHEYWWSKGMTACGKPGPGDCWSRDTVCGIGTTCQACCAHDQDCPWWSVWLGVCWCK